MLKKAIIITLLTICANSYAYPTPQCSVFRYGSLNGVTIGRVEMKNDRTGSYKLSVNMSAASYLDQNGNIKLQLHTPVNDIIKGGPLEYYIYFPSQTHIPKPTRIEFNGRVYCSGHTEVAKPGTGITNFWASTYISTGVSNYRPEPSPFYPETQYKPTEVDDNNPPFIDILHQEEEPSINNNNIHPIANPVHVQPTIIHTVQYTTPRNSDDLHTTYRTVIESNNSTVDCVNTTTVEHNVPKPINPNSWSSQNSSSFSYKCKQVNVSNQSIHTVSVSKG